MCEQHARASNSLRWLASRRRWTWRCIIQTPDVVRTCASNDEELDILRALPEPVSARMPLGQGATTTTSRLEDEMRILRMRTMAIAVVLGAASLAGVGLVATAGALGAPISKPTPPPGHSIAEAQAIIDAAHSADVQYLKNFVASGRDPRSLQRIEIAASGFIPQTLGEAVGAAQLVARASVIRTTFVSGAHGPLATSTLRLVEVLKAPASQSVGMEIQVLQHGGPVPQPLPMGGGLLQLPIDELVLAGDDVIILANFRPDLGFFQPLPGAGILFNKNGRIVPEESNRFGDSLAGATPAEVLTTMRQYIP